MTRKSLTMTLAIAAAATFLLVSTEATQAGGFSLSLGGSSFGSRNSCRPTHHQQSYRPVRHHREWNRHSMPRVSNITPFYGQRPAFAVQPYTVTTVIITTTTSNYRPNNRCWR